MSAKGVCNRECQYRQRSAGSDLSGSVESATGQALRSGGGEASPPCTGCRAGWIASRGHQAPPLGPSFFLIRSVRFAWVSTRNAGRSIYSPPPVEPLEQVSPRVKGVSLPPRHARDAVQDESSRNWRQASSQRVSPRAPSFSMGIAESKQPDQTSAFCRTGLHPSTRHTNRDAASIDALHLWTSTDLATNGSRASIGAGW
jgi:hypothetical protein